MVKEFGASDHFLEALALGRREVFEERRIRRDFVGIGQQDAATCLFKQTPVERRKGHLPLLSCHRLADRIQRDEMAVGYLFAALRFHRRVV